ncbi:MAG: hypothetical protein LQ338_007560 [Usnochroma carphineum]|nr:MAG: hypothetical protein LQ338_007560 [Usnochroma carphineum]
MNNSILEHYLEADETFAPNPTYDDEPLAGNGDVTDLQASNSPSTFETTRSAAAKKRRISQLSDSNSSSASRSSVGDDGDNDGGDGEGEGNNGDEWTTDASFRFIAFKLLRRSDLKPQAGIPLWKRAYGSDEPIKRLANCASVEVTKELRNRETVLASRFSGLSKDKLVAKPKRSLKGELRVRKLVILSNRYSPSTFSEEGFKSDMIKLRDIETALQEGLILGNLQSAEYITQVWKDWGATRAVPTTSQTGGAQGEKFL